MKNTSSFKAAMCTSHGILSDLSHHKCSFALAYIVQQPHVIEDGADPALVDLHDNFRIYLDKCLSAF